MERMRRAPCGVQISDFLNPKIIRRIKNYSCPALRLSPMTLYSENNGDLVETDFVIVNVYNYQDCWHIRDEGKCPVMRG